MAEPCTHPKEKIEPGPRTPARWGSWATEVCTACSHYRTLGHVVGRWEPCPVPTEEDYDE